MKAVGISNYLPVDDDNAFVDFAAERPEPADHDVRVAVKAIAVNPVDVKVRGGRGKEGVTENPPRIIGWDASGVVDAVGPSVTLFAPGDEVYYAGDITRSGSYTELQLVDERIVGVKPKSLSHAEAAALPLTTITAYESFFDRPRDRSRRCKFRRIRAHHWRWRRGRFNRDSTRKEGGSCRHRNRLSTDDHRLGSGTRRGSCRQSPRGHGRAGACARLRARRSHCHLQ